MPAVSLIPSALPVPVQLGGAASTPAAGGSGGSFSDALETVRQAPPVAATPAASPRPASGPSTSTPVPRPSATDRQATSQPSMDEVGDADPTRETGSADDARDARGAGDDTEATEDALPWLPWTPVAPARDPASTALAADAERVADAGTGVGAGPALPANGRGDAGTLAALPAASRAEDGDATTGLAHADASSGAAGNDPQGSDAQARGGQDPGARNFGATLAATSGGDGAAAGAAPATPAPALQATGLPSSAIDGPPRQVAPHLHSPAFAPALGAQLNLMVRDGVTEARLHLNPAEMGPISVQIRVVGQQARVEMVAEQAATRHALEQAMPALAGALRDSGLTLSGGGVFEQRDPRQGGQPDADGRPPRGGRAWGSTRQQADDLGGSMALRPAPLPRGVVDLYA